MQSNETQAIAMSTRASWVHSDRRKRLPRDWPQRRATVKARAQGMCQATAHAPNCLGIGAECDHIKPGDDHSLSNLQWLSVECHRAKTLREAQAGRTKITNRRRPAPIPPGLKIIND